MPTGPAPFENGRRQVLRLLLRDDHSGVFLEPLTGDRVLQVRPDDAAEAWGGGEGHGRLLTAGRPRAGAIRTDRRTSWRLPPASRPTVPCTPRRCPRYPPRCAN